MCCKDEEDARGTDKSRGVVAQVFDSMGTALWNHDTSSLYLDAAKTSLPCHDSLWVR